MNRRPDFYQRPVPRRLVGPLPRHLAGLAPVPTIPAEWMAAPSPTSQPNHCGISEESAQCAVEQLRPLNFTRSENLLLALLAGGFFGYWLGRERS